MRTRSRPRNAGLQIGDIAILSEVISRRKGVSDIKETWLITEQQFDNKGSICRLPHTAARIKPFMGTRVGHVEKVQLPSGTKRLKLIGIEEQLPEETEGQPDAAPE